MQGLIDVHVHVFHGTEEPDVYAGNSYTSATADAFSPRSGVTTAFPIAVAVSFVSKCSRSRPTGKAEAYLRQRAFLFRNSGSARR